MSNHLHDAIYDREGNAPAFYEHFHKLLAKCMNALRGRWENFFSSEQVCVVRLETREDLIEKLVYIATNPVKDGLVERCVTGRVQAAIKPSFEGGRYVRDGRSTSLIRTVRCPKR